MKKLLMVLVGASILLFGGMTANAAHTTIQVNGEILNVDTEPVNIDGRILIPLRSVGEALQCEVLWNDANKAVSMSDGNDIYIMWIGRDTLFKFTQIAVEQGYVSDVAPQLINEKTMIPIRCIAELMGATVDWIDETKTVTIDYTPNTNEYAKESAELGSAIIDIFAEDGYTIYKDYVFARENVIKAEIELENGNIIKLDLFPDIAPETVSQFVNLANSKIYDNTTFHRIVKDFVVQGGGFDNKGRPFVGIPTINGEFVTNNFMNFLSHKRGVISMARTDDPNSAASQFFIVHKDSLFLNAYYAAFGEVTEGMEYIDEIAEVETDENDSPVNMQVVKTIRILK